MHHDFFAWVRLSLLIVLILAFAFWFSACEKEYQLQHTDPADTTQEETITTTPTEAETAPEPTFIEPTEETTPPTEPATIPPEPPTEPATEPPTEPTIETTEPTQIRYPLTYEERVIVEAVVAAEARGEDFDGQALVALCILNTAEELGIRPDQVVFAPGQYTAPAYEYRHMVRDAVSAVFDYGYAPTEEPIRFFYAHKRGYSAWHENTLVFILEHGGHRFFRLP